MSTDRRTPLSPGEPGDHPMALRVGGTHDAPMYHQLFLQPLMYDRRDDIVRTADEERFGRRSRRRRWRGAAHPFFSAPAD